MWDTIDLREVRAFLAVAEELHFGRAAERLGVTQSRVSQTIRQLEVKLGGALFNRTSRRVSLTPGGERLLADLRPAHAELAEALKRTHDANRDFAGPLRVGLLSAAAGGPHLIAIVDAFERAHPHAKVELVEVAAADPFGPLRRGEVAAMASRLPLAEPDLRTGAILSEEPRVLAVARDHPLARRSAVSLEDVADYPVAPIESFPRALLEALVPTHAPSGRPIRRLPERTASVADVMTLIARGRIVHPTVPSLADYHGHPGIAYIPLEGMPPSRTALVWRRRPANAVVDELDRTARRVLDGLRHA